MWSVIGTSLMLLGSDPVVLPDTGVNVTGYTNTLIAMLGKVVIVVLGGFASYLLIRKAMNWMRDALDDGTGEGFDLSGGMTDAQIDEQYRQYKKWREGRD